MASGWAVLGDSQFLAGYCLLLADPVVSSLNDLDDSTRSRFLLDMAALGDALLAVTAAYRVNYEILGNTDPALHAHVFPRYRTEAGERVRGPVWLYGRDALSSTPFDLERDRPLMRTLYELLRSAHLMSQPGPLLEADNRGCEAPGLPPEPRADPQTPHNSHVRPAVEVEVVPAGAAVVRNLAEFWHYDFSEFLGADVGEDGRYGARGFDRAIDATSEWLLLRVDGAIAGFAVLRSENSSMLLSRFFVLRKYRRRGVGSEALGKIVDRRPGAWHLTVRPQNVGGLAFWRRTLRDYGAQEEPEREFEDGVRRIRFTFRGPTDGKQVLARTAPSPRAG